MAERALKTARRAGPVLLQVLGALLMAVVFVAAGVLGVALHANLPAGRRIAAATVTRMLTDTFQGQILVGNITRLGTRGLDVDEIRVIDPHGNTVIVLTDARARASLFDILEQLLFGGDKITIAIRHIRAERGEVQIIPEPDTGIPTLDRTFFMRHPSPDTPEPETPGRQLRVWMPNIEVGRVYGRGKIAGLPILETTVANVRGSVLVTPQGVAVDVERYGVILRGLGGADATGTGEVHVRAPGAVWTRFDGLFGEVGVNAFVYVRGDRVDVTLDVPQAEPGDVRALWPDWPIQRAVAAHIEASGEIPILETSGRFELDGMSVTANGPLTLSGDVGAKLDARIRGFDLRALDETAPATDIDADAAVAIWTRGGNLTVDFNGTSYPAEIDGYELPAIDATGTATQKGVSGRATLHEPGMPVKLSFDVDREGKIEFDAHARRFRIEKAPRAHAVVPARGYADLRVEGSIEHGQLDADVTADVSGFQYDSVRLAQGRVTGSAKGPISAPQKLNIDARLQGSNVASGDLAFEKIKGRAKGPVTRPKLDATLDGRGGQQVIASASLSTGKRPALHDLEVSVKRDEATLVGKVERLDLDGRRLEIRDLKIVGAGGEMAGNVRFGKDSLEVQARGDGIDLDQAARALGLPRGMFGGKLNIDADVSIGKDGSKGRVKLALGKGSIASLSGISLSLDTTLNDASLVGSASALIDEVGSFGAVWETELAGSPLEVTSWRDMIGRAQLNAINVELSHLKHAFPETARIESVEGKGFGQFSIERRIPAALPSVFMVAGTQGLEVVRAPADEDGEPLHVQGIDLQLGGQLDGATGSASGTTRLVDAEGELVKASGSMDLDLARMVRAPSEIGPTLLETPLDAVIIIPDRPLAELPEELRVTSLTGVVGGQINLTGTLSDPTISGKANVRNLLPAGSRLALPVDIQAIAQYSPKSGQAGGSVEVMQAGKRVGLLLAQGKAEWTDVRRGEQEGDAAWTGGTQLVLEGLPLGVFAPLAEARVGGSLWGTVAVHRPENAAVPLVSANVEIRNASVDLTPVGSGKLTVRSNGRLVNANLAFAHQRGRLDATGRAALVWDGLVPAIDDTRPVQIDAQARRFDAIVLSPFLRDVFSELSGPVTANASMMLRKNPAKKPGSPDSVPTWLSEIHGNAAMEDGVMQLQALGLELRDVSFGAVAHTTGRGTTIDINNVMAKARSNRPNVRARGSIYIEGVRVLRGNAAFSVAEMPLLLQGVSQATATGTATATLEREEDSMEVQVEIPELIAKLPRSSGRNVIEIDDNESIIVIQPLGEPEEASGPAMPWRFVINLGRDVRVRRNDMDVPITGQPVIELAEDTDVGGFVELEPGGRIQALGKVFVVESGRVRFDTDDPSDPSLTATASWRAPDGSTVYIDVKGTLKEAKVSFTSDPARPEQEIMALLLGGPAPSTGPDDEGAGGGAAAAGSAAVGGAAPIVNELLADSPLGRVEFRTASYEGRSSYTAAVRITESVWFETTYRSRETEQNTPNAETPDVSGTVDWRFRRNWSLRTEVGTLGTGLDLLWQYRY